MTTRVVTTVEELRELVGHDLGAGPWLELTQERVDTYAAETGDRQWIYVDPERAARSRFGGTIAPGFLLLGMTNLLQRNRDGVQIDLPAKASVNYGLNRVQLKTPVRVGQRIRAHTKLLKVEEVSPGVFQQTQEITIEIEGESEPAVVAEHVNRSYL